MAWETQFSDSNQRKVTQLTHHFFKFIHRHTFDGKDTAPFMPILTPVS